MGVEGVWPVTGAVEQRAAAAVWKTGGQWLQSLASGSHFCSMSGQEKAAEGVEGSKKPSGEIPQVNRLINTVEFKRILFPHLLTNAASL